MNQITKHILIADEFSTMRKIIKKIFLQIGHFYFSEAENKTKALKLLDQGIETSNPVDIILADLRMSDRGGLKLLEVCKADKRLTSIDFVTMGSELELSELKDSLALGAREFLVKPFDKSQITGILTKRLPTQTEKAS